MRELPVQVALSGVDDVLDLLVFLAPFSEMREGGEEIEDYLNGTRRFLPVLSRGTPQIVNRDEILWMRTPLDAGVPAEREADESEQAITHKPAALELADGSKIEGHVSIGQRPPERSRLSDILNDDKELFLRIDGDTAVYFVNKRFIRIAAPT